MTEWSKPDWWPAVLDSGGGQSFDDWRSFDRLYGALRHQPSRLLVLGMAPELVSAWLAFLPYARITRISNSPAAAHARLTDLVGAPASENAMSLVVSAAGGHRFDGIIDDGSHLVQDVWTCFDRLFVSWLESGGIYAVQSWGVSYLSSFSQGERPRLVIRPRAVGLGSRPPSHTTGLAGLVKGLIDHAPFHDVLAGGVDRHSVFPIRSVTAMHNVVGIERW